IMCSNYLEDITTVRNSITPENNQNLNKLPFCRRPRRTRLSHLRCDTRTADVALKRRTSGGVPLLRPRHPPPLPPLPLRRLLHYHPLTHGAPIDGRPRRGHRLRFADSLLVKAPSRPGRLVRAAPATTSPRQLLQLRPASPLH